MGPPRRLVSGKDPTAGIGQADKLRSRRCEGGTNSRDSLGYWNHVAS